MNDCSFLLRLQWAGVFGWVDFGIPKPKTLKSENLTIFFIFAFSEMTERLWYRQNWFLWFKMRVRFDHTVTPPLNTTHTDSVFSHLNNPSFHVSIPLELKGCKEGPETSTWVSFFGNSLDPPHTKTDHPRHTSRWSILSRLIHPEFW